MLRAAAPRTTLALDTRAPYAGQVPQPDALFAPPQPADAVTFQVLGEPQPQGSKTAFVRTHPNGDPVRMAGGRIMCGVRDANAARLKPWRKAVAHAARTVMGPRAPLLGPLVVEATFTMAKPASAPKRRRVWPDTRPDVDKLLRALLDGLTDGGVYADDGQVVAALAFKAYPAEASTGLSYEHPAPLPGVTVRITRLAWAPGEA
jgi:crossover junction endodeoxyribonuclease RusA